MTVPKLIIIIPKMIKGIADTGGVTCTPLKIDINPITIAI